MTEQAKTHCSICKERLVAGEFVIRTWAPINKKPPYEYAETIAHGRCEDEEAAKMWEQRARERDRAG